MSDSADQRPEATNPSSPDSTSPDLTSADQSLAGLTVAVLGAGNMGGAVVRAIRAAGVAAEQLLIVNSSPESSQRAAEQLDATAAADRADAVARADALVLGVKPYQILDVLAEVRDDLRPDALVISLAAGTTLAAMQEVLPAGQPLVRAMPNTPVGIGEGAVGLMFPAASGTGSGTDGAVKERARALFSAAGLVAEITEQQVHAFVGAAGSMPAFAFALIESAIDEAVRQGLKRDLATQLVVRTIRGSTGLLLDGDLHPALARNAVTSPGGTTAQGLAALAAEGAGPALAAAMETAADASRKMAGD